MPVEMEKQHDPRLTPAWFKLRYHEKQNRLWRTNCRFPVVVAGRGSGKTELARRFITLQLPYKKPWGDPKYFYGLPTYNQAKRVVWPQFEALIPKHWLIKNGANRSELTFTTKFGSTLYIVGMDKPARIEGIQVDGGILDECSDQKDGTFTRTILPMLTHRSGFCWQIGVPKRTGPGATHFKKCYDAGLVVNNKEGFESYTWPSYEILDVAQLDDILSKLSAKDALEQLGGAWVGASGAIYYAFDPMKNISDSAQYNPNLPIGIGSDFNVNPMAWILFHYSDSVFKVFDEIYLENSNTQATLDAFYRQYGGHNSGFRFFGDAAARQRRSSASSSDYLQILNDARFSRVMPHRVDYDMSNPRITDRYAAVNAVMLNAKGDVRCVIHPRCTELRKDLEQRTYKEGTLEADNTNKMSGHISDALGYPIYYLQPVYLSNAPDPEIYAGGN